MNKLSSHVKKKGNDEGEITTVKEVARERKDDSKIRGSRNKKGRERVLVLIEYKG